MKHPIETRQQLATFLGEPLEWKTSNLMDDWGSPQTTFLCPRCGAIVADPIVHTAWHIEKLL